MIFLSCWYLMFVRVMKSVVVFVPQKRARSGVWGDVKGDFDGGEG